MAVALTAAGGCSIIVMRHAARLLVGDLHPTWVGTGSNSDLSYPRPEIVTFVVLMALGALALLVLLARFGRRHPLSRLTAAGLLVIVVAAASVQIMGNEPALRCSEDTYTERTTCVAGSVAVRTDLATLLGPTIPVVLALTWDVRRRG